MKNELSSILILQNENSSDREKQKAYSDVYNYFSPRLEHFLRGYVNDYEDLQDIKIQTFSKAYSSIQNYDLEKFKFSTWLFSIARNLSIDYFRKSKTSPDVVSTDNLKIVSGDDVYEFQIDSGEYNPEDTFVDSENKEIYERALKMIKSDALREILEYREKGYKFREIEEITGVKINTIKVQVMRAKEALAKNFKTLTEA